MVLDPLDQSPLSGGSARVIPKGSSDEDITDHANHAMRVSQTGGEPITPKALNCPNLGLNTIHTPSAGKSIRLCYAALGADSANTSETVATLRFSGGSDLYMIPLAPGSLWARNIGAGRRYVQGPVNAPLVVNLSAAVVGCYVSIEFEEV